MIRRSLAGLAAGALLAGSAHAQNIAEGASITLDAAVRAADACEALARSKNLKVAIWVADDNGVPVHMKAMEGMVMPAGIYTAQMKTKTAKIWGSTTSPNDPKGLIGQTLKTPDGVVMNILLGAFPDEGGEAIFIGGPDAFRGGKLIGSIGVGGAGDFDEDCARAGVAAISKR